MAAEVEARHLVGAAPAPFWHRQPAKGTKPGRGYRRQHRRSLEKVCAGPAGPAYESENVEEEEEDARRLLQQKPVPGGYPVLPRPGGGHEAARGAPLWPSVASSSPFSRPHQGRKFVPNLLDSVQLERFEQDLYRSLMPSPAELAAKDHQLVMECLRYYNSNHPDDEYVPAPGKVTRYISPRNGSCWTHGNFVASPKRSGCFSFLPARRTLFFYELVTKVDFEGVVSCTPLDEPVTEAYTFLGLRLGWGTRRDGSSDCRCKTCNLLVDSRVPFVGKSFPCGHNKAECVCEMCYIHSQVLHPLPGKFAFANGH